MSTVTFRPAPAVQRIAEKLIPKHHEDLVDVDVRYVFRSEHAKSSGKAVFGRAKKISGLNAYLAQLEDPDETGIEGNDGDFFVIEIAEDIWGELTTKQREALVDHELCHCATTYDKDENLKLVCKPHDLEEFNAVVERHGLWRPDVTAMAEAMQLRLEIGRPSAVDDAVQDLIDAVPDGVKMTMRTHDGQSVVVADKTEAPSGSTDSAPPTAEAGPQSDDVPPDSTQAEPSSEANGASVGEQEQPAVDEPHSSTEDANAKDPVSTEPPVGSDADASAPDSPEMATPAQRLTLGRHIAGLDESLTSEFLTWCKNTKTPPNPQEMTFDQARKALILVGEREQAAAVT